MNAPFIPGYGKSFFCSSMHVRTRNEKSNTSRHLQIKPNGFSIRSKPLVSCSFHVHAPLMHQLHFLCIYIDCPYAVNFMPWAFVTEHQDFGFCRGELNVI